MRTNHWLVVGMLATGLASNIVAMHDWSEVYSPAGVAGILLTVGSVLTALFSEKVNQ
jgi:hypothetical protein